MVDPPSKPEEYYPLLKIEGGSGDIGRPQTIAPMSQSWIVRCSPKKSWLAVGLEFFSACWMTLILLGISFLAFYALGMSVYRRNPIIVIKCNDTKPASNVYYHHIIPRGAYMPFSLYSEYIANIASSYPYLRFNIHFLLDDSSQSALRNPRHGRMVNKIVPASLVNLAYNPNTDEGNKRNIRDFESKYENVNVTIMPLSKFMVTTPLKYNWRLIPFDYLPFYARIYSVWQNSGIALDLTTFNNHFNSNRRVDTRILAILKQHNDGIKPDEYTNALKILDCNEDTQFFGIFFTMFNQILNETRSFINNSLSFYPTVFDNRTFNSTLVRKHRAKRELANTHGKNPENSENSSTLALPKMADIKTATNLRNNYYQTFNNTLPVTRNEEYNANIKINKTNDSMIDLDIKLENKAMTLDIDNNNSKVPNNVNVPHVVMFYDFSIFNDGTGPSYVIPETIFQPSFGVIPTRSEAMKCTKHHKKPQFLSLTADGTFIAASTLLHPFLGHILFSNAYQYVDPKFAIKDTLSVQCYDMIRDDQYCNNIFLL